MDDGEGGDYSLIYDGSTYANVYSFTLTDYLDCGVLYNVYVVAVNSAGDSDPE